MLQYIIERFAECDGRMECSAFHTTWGWASTKGAIVAADATGVIFHEHGKQLTCFPWASIAFVTIV